MHRSYVCLSKRTWFCSFSFTFPLLHFFFLALPPPPPALGAFFLSSFFGAMFDDVPQTPRRSHARSR